MLKQSSRKQSRQALLYLAPLLLFAAVFVYYPFLRTILNSFSLVNAKGSLRGFAGLENFRYVFSRADFLPALRHTLILTAIDVPLILALTLSFALLANRSRYFAPFIETCFSLPMAVSMSAACMIFKSMLSPTVGFVNAFFGLKYGWFESRESALLSCALLTSWMGIGFDFLLLLSALRSIPRHILEAARVDGIPLLRRVFRVQLPLISPTIFYLLCTNLILAMMSAAPMIVILGSTPQASAAETLISMMYNSGLSSSDYGLAAVLSLTAFVLTLGLTGLLFLFGRKKVHYQ